MLLNRRDTHASIVTSVLRLGNALAAAGFATSGERPRRFSILHTKGGPRLTVRRHLARLHP